MADGTRTYLNEFEIQSLWNDYKSYLDDKGNLSSTDKDTLLYDYNIHRRTFSKWITAIERGLSKKRVNMGKRQEVYKRALRLIKEQESEVTKEKVETVQISTAEAFKELGYSFEKVAVAFTKLVAAMEKSK